MKLPALKEIVDERKDKAIESLSESFARNKLPMEEYERLVEYINKVESERELVVIEKIVREYTREYTHEYTREYAAEYDKNGAAAPEDTDEDEPYHYSHSTSNLTVLSSRTISGPIKSGTQYVSILGSEHIKIRKSDLEKRRNVLNVVSILGESVIFVESGIRVSNNAIPILGGTWTDHKVSKQVCSNEPELIISGAALLGNITVKLLKE
jgi:hypothetical protein